MTAQEFDQMVLDTNTMARNIVEAKRPSYTIGDSDVLMNFKRVSHRLGNITPAQVCAVYMLKHIDAIVASAGKGVFDIENHSRIADAINYLPLMKAILVETQGLCSPNAETSIAPSVANV